MYPSSKYINETVKETRQRELDIIYGYFHQNEKLLNINYDIPYGIINLCLVYYHKPIYNIYNSIIFEKPSIKWDQVIGLNEAKQNLKESLILPIKFPSLFSSRSNPNVFYYMVHLDVVKHILLKLLEMKQTIVHFLMFQSVIFSQNIMVKEKNI